MKENMIELENSIKIISEETKKILENFFCFNGVDSRKKFEKLIITKHKYEGKEWDTEQSIVNHLLSHPQFKFNKSKLSELGKISKDWSSINKNKENSLFFMIKSEMKLIEINDLIETFKIDTKQKDKDNLYFVNYFLKTETFKKIIDDSLNGKNNFPEIRVAKELKKYQEILMLYPELFKETYQKELEKLSQIKEDLNLKEFREKNQKNAINADMDSEMKKVEQILFYFSLDNNLSSKNKDKKMKI